MVCLEDGNKVLLAGCGRSSARLEAREERGKDGTEKGDLLVGDLVENGDEGTDSLEEVELRVEESGRSGRFCENLYGRRF